MGLIRLLLAIVTGVLAAPLLLVLWVWIQMSPTPPFHLLDANIGARWREYLRVAPPQEIGTARLTASVTGPCGDAPLFDSSRLAIFLPCVAGLAPLRLASPQDRFEMARLVRLHHDREALAALWATWAPSSPAMVESRLSPQDRRAIEGAVFDLVRAGVLPRSEFPICADPRLRDGSENPPEPGPTTRRSGRC